MKCPARHWDQWEDGAMEIIEINMPANDSPQVRRQMVNMILVIERHNIPYSDEIWSSLCDLTELQPLDVGDVPGYYFPDRRELLVELINAMRS